MEKMDVLDLTKKLVSIPSFVGQDSNEKLIGEFVYSYLKKFKWLTVIKQPVKDGRFNVLAFDSKPTELLIVGHLDTVQPRSGWNTNPLRPVITDKKLYGLGTADMKSGIAAMLSALNNFQKTSGLMLLFYVDEEYDFLGMKKFIEKYRGKIKPKLIVSGDGGDFKIRTGCRGLIEITLTVCGQTAHAGRPKLGKNAILISTNAVNELIKIFETDFQDKTLGSSTCNLAFIQGGLNLGKEKNGSQMFGREGNNVADITQLVVDIRPANPQLNAKKVINLLGKLINKQGGKITDFRIRHDLGSWITKPEELTQFKTTLGNLKMGDPQTTGFIDTQMLWQIFNCVPCFTIGAGKSATAHKPNEYLDIPKLERLSNFFTKLIHLREGGE